MLSMRIELLIQFVLCVILNLNVLEVKGQCSNSPSGSFQTNGNPGSCLTNDNCFSNSAPCTGGYCTEPNPNGGSYSYNCRPCNAGYYGDGNSCIPCPASSYTTQQAQPVCNLCPAGTASSKVGSSNGADCQQCSAGLFSPGAGQTACTQCALGKYSNSLGVSICTDCSPGKANGILGATSCSTTCSHSSSGAASCSTCPPGTYWNNNNNNCQPCNPGSYSANSDQTSCTSCEIGKFQPSAGAITCISTSPGFHTQLGSSTLSTQTENTCPAGQFCIGGSSVPLNCPSGTFSLPGSSSCASCLAGYYSPSGSSYCSNCASGYFSSTPNSAVCSPCTPGNYSFIASTACYSCPAGSFSSGFASNNCTNCPAGTFTNSSALSSCFQCNAGSYSSFGSSVCYKCIKGSFSSSSGSSNCSQCSAGSFASQDGATACDFCPPGKYSSDSASVCMNCLPGYYSAVPNQSKCYACSPGSFASSFSTSNCSLCDAGFYSSIGAVSCVPCSINYYNMVPGSSLCSSCSPGSFAALPGSSSCTLCASGKYRSNIGESGCIDTPPGTFVNGTGSQSFLLCNPGSFSTQYGASSCDVCPPGTFQSAQGSAGCINCPSGSYAPLGGSTSCLQCPDGYVSSNRTGSSSCNICGHFYYSRQSLAASQCTPCPDGTYTLSYGSSTCSSCDGISGVLCKNGTVIVTDGFWGFAVNGSIPYLQTVPCPPALCPSNNLFSQCDSNLGRIADNQFNPNVLCGLCQPDHSSWNGVCLDCSKGPNGGVIFGFLVICFVYVAVLHVISQEKNDNALMSIFVYFLQTGILIVGPESSWLAWVTFINFSPQSSTSSSTPCPLYLTPYEQMALSIFISFFFFIVLGVICSIHKLISITWKISDKFGFNFDSYIRTSVVLVLFSYSQILSAVLAFLNCVDGGEQRKVLFSHPSINCSSDEYKGWLPIVYILLIGNTMLVPIIVGIFLFRRRKLFRKLNDNSDFKFNKINETQLAADLNDQIFFKRFGILFESYSPRCYWWQLVILARRIACVLVDTFIITGLQWKSVSFLLIHAFSLLVDIYVSPYVSKWDNIMEHIAFVSLCLLSSMVTANPIPYTTAVQILSTLILFLPSLGFLIVKARYVLSKQNDEAKNQKNLEKLEHSFRFDKNDYNNNNNNSPPENHKSSDYDHNTGTDTGTLNPTDSYSTHNYTTQGQNHNLSHNQMPFAQGQGQVEGAEGNVHGPIIDQNSNQVEMQPMVV